MGQFGPLKGEKTAPPLMPSLADRPAKFQLTGALGLTNGSRKRANWWWAAALVRQAAPNDFSRGPTVAKPELGNKHSCQNCGTKFFDLNKSPVVCPKCGTVQQVATRVTRAAPAEKDEEEAETGVEIVSLDEVEQSEAALETTAEDDVEIEDEGGGDDDDTFLEEEEEDSDDVSGLIDGDIAPDEEP
jgi:uncharacterized protein (TIGR02300 family)